jgi:cell shape-determining protein MreC
MCKIDVNGVSITLTAQQLKQIEEQTKKNIPIYERVNDFKSLLKELNTTETKLLPYKYSSSDKFEQYVNACIILAKVAELYNEGVVLDWENSNVYKYYNYKYFSGGGSSVGVAGYYSSLPASARLCFKSEKLAKLAYQNFKDEYEQYWSIDV